MHKSVKYILASGLFAGFFLGALVLISYIYCKPFYLQVFGNDTLALVVGGILWGIAFICLFVGGLIQIIEYW